MSDLIESKCGGLLRTYQYVHQYRMNYENITLSMSMQKYRAIRYYKQANYCYFLKKSVIFLEDGSGVFSFHSYGLTSNNSVA